jgi:hypothetical protein
MAATETLKSLIFNSRLSLPAVVRGMRAGHLGSLRRDAAERFSRVGVSCGVDRHLPGES